jgi:acyl-CoA-binding protein
MLASFDSIRGSPRSSSKVAADPLPTVPDPLIQHLGFPDKFYIVAAFVDDPPEVGVRRVDDDTALLLHALHEQATKGPCTKPRPWSFFETDAQLKWDAWKALEKMPALEAMMLYCRTVEEDNPNWWHLLTATISAREKREIIDTAAECAREYRKFVQAGVLIGPSDAAAPPYLQTEPPSTRAENEDWASASRALAAIGLSGLSDVIDYLSSSRPVKPWSRGDRSINHPSKLPPDRGDVVSVSAMKARLKSAQNAPAEAAVAALASGAVSSELDAIAPMLTWRVVATRGTPPAPRYHHCAWVVDSPKVKNTKAKSAAPQMWVTHGSLNGKKLPGTPAVLCLRALEWTMREAREEGGDAPAAVSGAAALLAPNDAAYVFGGAARTRARGVGGFFGRADDDDDENSRREHRAMCVRVLDLTEDPGPPDDRGSKEPREPRGKKRRPMEWIDAVAEDASPTRVEVGEVVEVIVDDEMLATPEGSPANAKVGGSAVVSADRKALLSSRSPLSSRTENAGPCARVHHSATLVGGEVYVFGGSRVAGDGQSGAALGDLWAFNGAEGTWRLVTGAGDPGGVVGGAGAKAKTLPVADTKWHGAPSPRSGHVAGAADDRFLLIFGGDESGSPGGSSSRLADTQTHVFDTWAQRWVQAKVTGKPPAPRAGHAACALGGAWYVSGGGDHREARPETFRLDTRNAAEGRYHWQVVNTGVGDGQALAAGREGMSLVPFRGTTGEFLVAFGGSDGTCRGDVRVMRVSDWTTGKSERY